MCWRPLWTAIVSPTNSGITTERSYQVRIGRLDPAPRAAIAFVHKWPSTKGPFLTDRGMATFSYAGA